MGGGQGEMGGGQGEMGDAVYPEVKVLFCVFPLGRDYIMH